MSKKIGITHIRNIVKAATPSDNTVTFSYDGESIDIAVRQYIGVQETQETARAIANACFVDGEYYHALYDCSVCYFLLTSLTNIDTDKLFGDGGVDNTEFIDRLAKYCNVKCVLCENSNAARNIVCIADEIINEKKRECATTPSDRFFVKAEEFVERLGNSFNNVSEESINSLVESINNLKSMTADDIVNASLNSAD